MNSHPTEAETENRKSEAFAGKPFWYAMLIAAGIFLLMYSCREQILSNPVGDPDTVLSRCPAAEFETLDGWPRTETHIRKERGDWLNADQVLEIFELKEGQTEYRCYLFANSAAASDSYDRKRPSGGGVAPIKLEKVVDANVRGFLRHVIRPRSGAGALRIPKDYYFSDAVFQLRNAVVEVEVRLAHKKARDMEVALKRLAEIVGSSQPEKQRKPKNSDSHNSTDKIRLSAPPTPSPHPICQPLRPGSPAFILPIPSPIPACSRVPPAA